MNAPGSDAPSALNLAKVLQQMLAVSDKVSDLIFSPGRPPQIELVGKLQPVSIAGVEKLSPAQTSSIAKLIIGGHEGAAESLEKVGSADLSFSVPGLSRFRVNIFRQRSTRAIVMRVIPPRPPRFEDFNLPPQLREIVELKIDGELEKMVRAGIVTKEDALAYSSNQGNLLLRLGEYGAGGPPKPTVEPKGDSMLDMIER